MKYKWINKYKIIGGKSNSEFKQNINTNR